MDSKTVKLELEMAPRLTADRMRHLSVNLSVRDGETLETLRESLVAQRAVYVLADGKTERPVWMLADAARWLLQQLGNQLDEVHPTNGTARMIKQTAKRQKAT